MRVNKTNLSVIDNTGARIQPRIIIGDNAGYKSGDILDANAVTAEIENTVQYGKYRVLVNYDENVNKLQIKKDDYLDVTWSEYENVCKEVLNGKIIPTILKNEDFLSNGFLGCYYQYEEGVYYLAAVGGMDSFLITPPIREVIFDCITPSNDMIDVYNAYFSDWLDDHPNTIFYNLSYNQRMVDKSMYQGIISGTESESILPYAKINANTVLNINYVESDILFAYDDNKQQTYVFVPNDMIRLWAVRVSPEVEQQFLTSHQELTEDYENVKVFYLKNSDQQLLDNTTYGSAYEIGGDDNYVYVENGIHSIYPDTTPSWNRLCSYITDTDTYCPYIPYEQ